MTLASHSRCWAEVDLAALRHNAAVIRRSIGPSVKLMAVVKANAYGHGLTETAAALMSGGSDAFAVANTHEAVTLRQVIGAKFSILQFGSPLAHEIEAMIEHGITPTLASLDDARQFNVAAAARHKPVPVHLEIDTGMGRSGFWQEEADAAIHQIAALPNLQVEGVYTHFPSADENLDVTRQHLSFFLAAVKKLNFKPLLHAANSAGLVNLPEARLDIVRAGLLLYGVCPPDTHFPDAKPVLSFHSRVTHVKSVAAGRTISYGQTYVAPKPMTVATIGAGYADGFRRHLSNKGHVLVGGKHCAVLGRVTMDQIMVDVSDVPNVRAGDEVVFIGKQGDASLSATEVSIAAGTIAWDILCGINQTPRVPRIYRDK